ncbi:MAG: phosphatidate cytidylyltransferase [Spirochaetaceae bacterium]|nr:phosphatidate cytidylyltransferase [Spirochaetaceae bacterium]
MNKLAQRLMSFFFGIPIVLSLVLFHRWHHLVLHAAIVFTSFAAVREMYHLLEKKSPMLPLVPVAVLTLLLPITAWWCASFDRSWEYVVCVLFAVFAALSFLGIFFSGHRTGDSAEAPFALSNSRLTSSFFAVFYAGFLITYLSRLTTLDHSQEYLVLFFLMVFLCDSSAWLFGVTMGKNNRGLCRVSPNKSAAGFVGGVLGTGLAVFIGWFLWGPDILPGSPVKLVPLTVCVSLAGIMGDLLESLVKRSSDSKDSGRLIPGRGGILDSIDSILLAAPIYFFCIKFLYDV